MKKGIFYILAAINDWRPFFYFTVALRFFTVLITNRKIASGNLDSKFGQVAVADGAGAVLTLAALAYEKIQLGY